MRAEPGPSFTHTAGLARHYLSGLSNVISVASFCDFLRRPLTRPLKSNFGFVMFFFNFPLCFGKTALLTDMLKMSSPVQLKWTEESDMSFSDLKRLLCEEPVLQGPDFNRRFVLQTDASRMGLGAVLSQR